MSGDYDLIRDNSPGTGSEFSATHLLSDDPKLDALANNGGPTGTMALEADSPAIGYGIAADFPGTTTAITVDQRHYSRPGSQDLGAYSYNGVAPPPSPSVTSISPTLGTASGGTTVTIIGTNFTGATTVDFGTFAASSFTIESATEITVTSPSGSAGIVDVTVVGPGGTSLLSSADQFAYLGATMSYTVTSTADVDNDTDGVTLRYAIDQAVAGNEVATIGFSSSLDDQMITLANDDTSAANVYGATAFVVNGAEITIDGSNAPGLVISGNSEIRPFAVTSTGSLTLDNLTITAGQTQGGAGGSSGGGGGGGGGAGLGGAVYDDGGSFTADGVTFTNNQRGGGFGGASNTGSTKQGGGGGAIAGPGASGSAGGSGGAGGGGNGGAFTTVSQKGGQGSAGGFGGGGGGGGSTSLYAGQGGQGGFGGGGGGGGGIHNAMPGTGAGGGFLGGDGRSGIDSTATGYGGGGAGMGGGIFSNGGSVTLVNDTFTGNSAIGGFGGHVGSGRWRRLRTQWHADRRLRHLQRQHRPERQRDRPRWYRYIRLDRHD